MSRAYFSATASAKYGVAMLQTGDQVGEVLGIGEQPEPVVSQQHAGEHEPRDRCHEHRDDDFRERESVRSGTTHVDHDSA